MTPLTAERFTHLPQHPRRPEDDLDDIIRILAKALAENDRRAGHVCARGSR